MQNRPDQHYSIRYDVDAGVVRVTLGQDVPDEVFAQYCEDLTRAIGEAHAVSPAARILIDGRELEAMPTNSADRVPELSQLFAPDDRVAMILRSSVLKMEARRIAHSAAVQAFLSENAAWTWLFAYDMPDSSAA